MSSVILSSEYNSLKNAFLQDWPYGRKRCIRAIWVEHNGIKGMRFGYATSKRAMLDLFEEWVERMRKTPELPVNNESISRCFGGLLQEQLFNKPKYGIYNRLVIIDVDEENKETHVHNLHKQAWEEHIREFADKYGDRLDEHQMVELCAVLPGGQFMRKVTK